MIFASHLDDLRSWLLIISVSFVAVNDLRHYRITNRSVMVTMLGGLGWSVAFAHQEGLVQSLLGILVGFLLLVFLYGMGGVTAGDVKWLAALGAWYGPKGILGVFLFSGGILGLLSLGWLAYCAWKPVGRGIDSQTPPSESALDSVANPSKGQRIDVVYQSSERRRRMIPYAIPVAVGILLLELSRIVAA